MNGSYVIGRRRAGRAEENGAAPQVRIDPEAGLSSADAALSKKLYGSNTLTRKKKKGPVREFFANLSDPVIRILLFAMGINLILTFGRSDIFALRQIRYIPLQGFDISFRRNDAIYRALRDERGTRYGCSTAPVRGI